MVDEPYSFGMIAAANSLSDVYAMGGRPLLAMNVVTFPIKKMDKGVLKEVLAGGLEKIKEARALLVGGHSVEDREMKYGLSLTGLVHPDRVIRNSGAIPGDLVLLTKPLGTGIISTAIKGGLATEEQSAAAVECMATLNRIPGELMAETGANACTDITGFGLAGHLHEIAEASGVMLEIEFSELVFINGVSDLASMGIIPEGAYTNKKFYSRWVESSTGDDRDLICVYDPQTSGGLLITGSEEQVNRIRKDAAERGYPFPCKIIGRVKAASDKTVGMVRFV